MTKECPVCGAWCADKWLSIECDSEDCIHWQEPPESEVACVQCPKCGYGVNRHTHLMLTRKYAIVERDEHVHY